MPILSEMRKEQFIGKTLNGGYIVEQMLGEGSFGTTYLAFRGDKTPVAVKIFNETSDPLKLVELAQEALIIAQLRHSNIVPFHKFDIQERRLRDEHEKETTEHYPFIVMGYANEGSLRRLKPTKSTTALAADQVINILVQAASGVQFAHDAPNPVIHRDLKPENILLHRENPTNPHFDVLIGDFGIAIAAHSETSLEPQKASGTLPYTAPEQLNGRALRASDQFALGVIAYELLTGKRPFTGVERDQQPLSFSEMLKRIGNEKLIGLILERLEEVVMKALANNPLERYPSVYDFAHLLQETHINAVEEQEKQRKLVDTTVLEKENEVPPEFINRIHEALHKTGSVADLITEVVYSNNIMPVSLKRKYLEAIIKALSKDLVVSNNLVSSLIKSNLSVFGKVS